LNSDVLKLERSYYAFLMDEQDRKCPVCGHEVKSSTGSVPHVAMNSTRYVRHAVNSWKQTGNRAHTAGTRWNSLKRKENWSR